MVKDTINKSTKTLGKVGFIGRFKPLHLGAARVLEYLCANASHVYIGIGSSNKYNLRNPFTSEETQDMLNKFLSPNFSNYTIIPIPDFAQIPEYADGKKWASYVRDKFGSLDVFVSGNPFVSDLLKGEYKIKHPSEILPKERHIKLCATDVRLAMARDEKWQSLVPKEVADYLEKNHLVERFRNEFGLATLASLADTEKKDERETERSRAREK